MKILVLGFVFVAASVLGAPEIRPKPRIIGGNDADIKDYPHQVSVEWLEMHICSGTIIDDIHVITAAHCLDYKNVDDVNIRAGSSLLDDQDSSSLSKIKAFHTHPRYTRIVIEDGLRYVYDVAILELEEPLPIEYERIGAIDLADQSEVIADGTDVAVLGWGTTSENSQEYSKQLQKVLVKTVSHADCVTDYEDDVELEGSLCAGNTGEGFCQGDDGSPLIHDAKLFGIASWQVGCGQENKPGVYESIADEVIRSFILQVTGL